MCAESEPRNERAAPPKMLQNDKARGATQSRLLATPPSALHHWMKPLRQPTGRSKSDEDTFDAARPDAVAAAELAGAARWNDAGPFGTIDNGIVASAVILGIARPAPGPSDRWRFEYPRTKSVAGSRSLVCTGSRNPDPSLTPTYAVCQPYPAARSTKARASIYLHRIVATGKPANP